MVNPNKITKTNLIDFMCAHKADRKALAWARKQISARDIVEKCPDDRWIIWFAERISGSAHKEYMIKYNRICFEFENNKDRIFAEYMDQCALAAREALTWERICETY